MTYTVVNFNAYIGYIFTVPFILKCDVGGSIGNKPVVSTQTFISILRPAFNSLRIDCDIIGHDAFIT